MTLPGTGTSSLSRRLVLNHKKENEKWYESRIGYNSDLSEVAMMNSVKAEDAGSCSVIFGTCWNR